MRTIRKHFQTNVHCLMFVILCLGLLTTACSPTKRNVKINSEAFSTIERERIKAEENVKTLKMNYPVGSPEYERGREYYTQAQAEYNGYIEELKSKVVVGQVSDLRPKLSEAVTKSDVFSQYVASPVSFKEISVDPIIISVLVDILLDAGVKIWKEYQGAEKEKRDAILLQLDTLKWKSFDEIEPRTY